MRARGLLVASVLSSFAVVIAAPTFAAPPPDPTSGIAQYVETLPSAGGAQRAGHGSGHTRRLTPAALRALRSAGVEGKVLKLLATSAAYGAPRTQQTGVTTGANTGSVEPESTSYAGLIVELLLASAALAMFALARRRDAQHGAQTAARS